MKLTKVINILFFLLIPFSVFSQTDTANVCTESSCDYKISLNNKEKIRENKILDSLFNNVPIKDSVRRYYKYVYEAESYLMDNKFDKAAKTYSIAFEYLKFPFAKDLRKAIDCELKSNQNKENIIKYCWLLKNKTMLGSTAELENLSWWQELKNTWDTVSSKINQKFFEDCKNIHKADQDIRNYSYNKYGPSYVGQGRDTILAVDTQNYKDLISIIKKLNIFSEEYFGNSWAYIQLVLKHNSDYYDFFILTHKDIVNGNFDVRNYADVLNKTYSINYIYPMGQDVSYGHNFNNWIYVYSYPFGKDKQMMNKFRKQICLEDIDTYYKKQAWQFQNAKRGYFYPGITSMYDSDSFIDNNYYIEGFHDIVLTGLDVYGSKVKIFYKNKEEKKAINKQAKELIKIKENKQMLEEYKTQCKEKRKYLDDLRIEQREFIKQIYK